MNNRWPLSGMESRVGAYNLAINPSSEWMFGFMPQAHNSSSADDMNVNEKADILDKRLAQTLYRFQY